MHFRKPWIAAWPKLKSSVRAFIGALLLHLVCLLGLFLFDDQEALQLNPLNAPRPHHSTAALLKVSLQAKNRVPPSTDLSPSHPQGPQNTNSSLIASSTQPSQYSANSPHPTLVASPFLARIRHQIESALYYPTSLRRRGIQGQTVLRIKLTHAGTLQQVTLLKSSGYPELDDLAQQAAHDAAPFPATPTLTLGETQDSPYQIILPIIFETHIH